MEFFDYLIVGSGPAGIGAARRLKGASTCIIDVGKEPTSVFSFNSLREGLASGNTRALLGQNWEMLANLVTPGRLHSKLRAAPLRHVLSGEAYSVANQNGHALLNSHGSYAAGGMANAWGSQLFRYTQADLNDAGDWPISANLLDSYYTDLEEHIGLSGKAGDLLKYLGRDSVELQPPIPMVPAAEYLFRRYQRLKSVGKIPSLDLAHPRLAVLTQPHRGRPAYDFNETEFFACDHPGVYSPKLSLSEMQSAGEIQYLSQSKVVQFREYPDYVEVDIEIVGLGTRSTLRCRHLLLGCGTIQTASLVLQNRNGQGHSLPFVDHTPTMLPVFFPTMFGSALAEHSFPVQLIGALKSEGAGDLVSFYYPGGLLWSDLLPDIPLPLNSALRALQTLAGGMLVAQIWEPSRPMPENRLRLDANGCVVINYPNRPVYPKLSNLITELRRLGGFTLKSLASTTVPTWGFHHASTMPMRRNPGPFETHVDGRLWDSRRVRIIDGSVLPSLPSKNHWKSVV